MIAVSEKNQVLVNFTTLSIVINYYKLIMLVPIQLVYDQGVELQCSMET